MAITIQMIETKEFKIVQRGYDPEEVDMFLDEIGDEIEMLQKEIKSLRAEADRARRTPAAPAPAPVAAPRSDSSDETIRTMLVNAQRVCDDTIADAKKQAQGLVGDAQREATDVVRNARTEAQRLEENMETLRSAVADYRARFKQLLEDQAHLLDADKML